ncbi:MAG: PIG-L family deacetylase [Blastocatellia bacterium]|nr:PIG-L family deacetylase [Blastocatellia bacterium]
MKVRSTVGFRLYVLVVLAGLALFQTFQPVGAQDAGPVAGKPKKAPSRQDVATYQALKNLESPYTLVCVAAHPDDEDGASLVYYRMSKGVRTATITSNHGEGGQNAVNDELGLPLGVTRTKEMEAAGKVQDAECYNLCLEDFGFSKSSAEALERWGHTEALRRLVLKIRQLRPDVVITHHDTKTGHGHHQAVGVLIQEAFETAADPQKFPEQLRKGLAPWQIRRLYERVLTPTGTPDVTYDVNVTNSFRQKSYAQVALDALRMHATQGPWPNRDFSKPLPVRYRLVKAKNAGTLPPNATDLFANLKEGDKADASTLFGKLFENNFKGATPAEQWMSICALATDEERTAAKRKLSDSLLLAMRWARLQMLTDKEQAWIYNRMVETMADALIKIAEVDIKVQPSPEIAVPGEGFLSVRVTVANNGKWPVSVRRINLKLPENWEYSGDFEGEDRQLLVIPGQADDYAFRIRPTEKVKKTLPAVEHLYDEDFYVPQIQAILTIAENSVRFPVVVSARMDLAAPVIAEGLPATIPVLFRDKEVIRQQVVISVERFLARIEDGELSFASEGGVTVTPKTIPVKFGKAARKLAFPVTVEIPRTVQNGKLACSWRTIAPGKEKGSKESRDKMEVGATTITKLDVKVPEKLRVGFVRSYDFTLPKSFEMLGITARDLKQADWEPGALAKNFDTVVLDNRVYLAQPELQEHQAQLMEFVEQGGHLVVFYHKTGEFKPEWGAYPLTISDRRIAEENAPVKILLPEHPLLTWPNAITAQDFDGWVQERGVYFPTKWDEKYQPLLASADKGEEELRGGYLFAERGKGSYVYTSYVWYRQLRANHQGAFRMFVNLVAYPLRPKN